MKTQHTPGPWEIHKSMRIIGPKKKNGLHDIVCLFPAMRQAKICKVNARLIAAAPEMLSTLEKIQVAAELAIHGGSNDLFKFCELVMMNTRPIIKKAKGE